MALRLMQLEFASFDTIACFNEPSEAAKHLDRHLLSKPECQGWRLLIPDYDSIVHDRFRYARRLMKQSSEGQPLYERYAETIQRAMNDAEELGWYDHPESGHLVVLGLDGLVTYIYVPSNDSNAPVVKTAYLPKWADPEVVKGKDEVPLARESENTYQTERGESWSSRSSRSYREDWSREQVIFYDVFRRAMSAVRKATYEPSSHTKDTPRGEMSRLLDPIRNAMDRAHEQTETDRTPDRHKHFRAWNYLREQVRQRQDA